VNTVEVHALTAADRAWVREVVARDWGSPLVISPGGLRDVSDLPGFVALDNGERVGLVTFEFDDRHDCEVVTLDSYLPEAGVGTALLDAVRDHARSERCARLWLTTTNDNTHALRFYQRRGWNLLALHRDILAEWRKLKPSMSELGIDGIPMRHALELELRL
jgi:ribosomal protein S18 acetylase RimI-like enzyme